MYAHRSTNIALAIEGGDLRSFKIALDKVNCQLFDIYTFTHK